MSIANLIKEHGLTQSGLSRMLGIPLRTVQGWCIGERTPPEWVVNLIQFYLEHK